MPRSLSEKDQLIIAQAFWKVIAKAVDTKDPDSLRSRVDAAMRQLYESTGGKTYDMMLNGMKVGSYGLRFSKEVHERRLRIDDDLAFCRWAWRNGLAKKQILLAIDVEDWMPENLVDIEYMITEETWRSGVAQEHYVLDREDALAEAAKNGEVPDGCVVEAIDEPARLIGSTLRIEPQLVARALGESLPSAIAGLLPTGGE